MPRSVVFTSAIPHASVQNAHNTPGGGAAREAVRAQGMALLEKRCRGGDMPRHEPRRSASAVGAANG